MTVWNNYDEGGRSKLTIKCGELGYSEACEDMWNIVCGNDWTDDGYNINSLNENTEFCTISSALKPQKETNLTYETTSKHNSLITSFFMFGKEKGRKLR